MKRFDFALNWSGNIKETFVKLIEKECKAKKMTFLWINDDNVRSILRKLQSDQIYVHVLLDTEATYNKKADPYGHCKNPLLPPGSAVACRY